MQISCVQGCRPEALVSRKVVWGDPSIEGSETTKSDTDRQKSYKRHNCLVEEAQPVLFHGIIVMPKEYQKDNYVDTPVIGEKKEPLPWQDLE